MSSDFAIRVNNIGKQYQLGHVVSFKRTLRETITAIPSLFAKKSLNILNNPRKISKKNNLPLDLEKESEHFWALKKHIKKIGGYSELSFAVATDFVLTDPHTTPLVSLCLSSLFQ